MRLSKYSLGVGDRFGHQCKAQLSAVIKAKERGIEITPVWNKSYREHEIIGSNPIDTRRRADAAVKECGWTGSYFVDADHVCMKTVDLFLDSSDFFTIDVADYIGQIGDESCIDRFIQRNKKFMGDLNIPTIDDPFEVTEDLLRAVAEKYLFAVEEAGRIYRHILERRREGSFIVEVSMDETDERQSPLELFFILEAISQEGIPAQTIAPKFTGRFNKGVDYVGDIDRFTQEFEQDLAVLQFAVVTFPLPQNLKLSIHSGSDKFAIYAPIRGSLKKFDAGLHLKTAGTTWLEELIGLAEAGGGGLIVAKEIYRRAFSRMDELCRPYANVIDIQQDRLPDPNRVDQWDGHSFVSALRHDQTNGAYNPDFRQLLHVSCKIAAGMKDQYLSALKRYDKIISKNVMANLYDRHIKRLFF